MMRRMKMKMKIWRWKEKKMVRMIGMQEKKREIIHMVRLMSRTRRINKVERVKYMEREREKKEKRVKKAERVKKDQGNNSFMRAKKMLVFMEKESMMNSSNHIKIKVILSSSVNLHSKRGK